MSKSSFATVSEMIERIKDVACVHHKGKVFDMDVAALLRMGNLALASAKKRDAPPIKQILFFCNRTGIDPMRILF